MHMCWEHTSLGLSACHRTDTILGRERWIGMYDFLLGVFASLAVLIIAGAYKSYVGSDNCGEFAHRPSHRRAFKGLQHPHI